MITDLSHLQATYAELVVRTGVNIQPGQSMVVRAELEHAPFVRLVVAAAYQAGARYVHVEWQDALCAAAFLRYGKPETVDYPAYEIARFQQMTDEGWARLALVGPEAPNAYDEADPTVTRNWDVLRRRAIRFYTEVMMANKIQWCVAGVPTAAWAQKIFPGVAAAEAVERLWLEICRLVRADRPDPAGAWDALNRSLQTAADYFQRNQVRAVHFVDSAQGPDGKPATDLVVGLTDRPKWVGGVAHTPAGVAFQPNMPTEEIFCTPHNQRTHGYVRTSKPTFPFQREVNGAWFRFEEGKVVDFSAETGQPVLEQFFEINGARSLGEVSLVDVSSPVFQSGLLFHEILFDENAACHIAFGEAYPECVEGAANLSREDLEELGVNFSDTHVDFMIGTPTMNVTGLCVDGREIPIMREGRFVEAITA